MLTTAVTGTIFASPSVEHIRTAIASLVNISQYVLITVTNYTGDVLNFGMPVERAKAAVIAAEMVGWTSTLKKSSCILSEYTGSSWRSHPTRRFAPIFRGAWFDGERQAGR